MPAYNLKTSTLTLRPQNQVIWPVKESSALGQICRLFFFFQRVPCGVGSDPADIASTPVSRHSTDNSTAICFWDVYYSCSFCFTKVYRKLIKITTNSFSFPQVQVINSSQKPSKLLMRWIYGRYYCAWPPEYSLQGYHQHEKIKFVSLSSHTTSCSLRISMKLSNLRHLSFVYILKAL